VEAAVFPRTRTCPNVPFTRPFDAGVSPLGRKLAKQAGAPVSTHGSRNPEIRGLLLRLSNSLTPRDPTYLTSKATVEVT